MTSIVYGESGVHRLCKAVIEGWIKFDAFRKLLIDTKFSQKPQISSILPPKKPQSSNLPTFQPRKLGKDRQGSTYRDDGQANIGNDYRDAVHTLPGDIDSKDIASKDNHTGKKREGDEDHPVLVKGLDFALLEKTKSQFDTQEEDDALEATFQEIQSKSETPVAKKRTREDVIRALKEHRTAQHTHESSISAFEKAKQLGKFKPIGAPDTSAKKVRQQPRDGEVKPRKKKRKVSPKEDKEKSETKPFTPTESPDEKTEASIVNRISHLLPLPNVDEVLDIFADVGEYKGLDLDEEEENENVTDNKEDGVSNQLGQLQKNWFGDHNVSPGMDDERSHSPAHPYIQPPMPPPPPLHEQEDLQSNSVVPTRLEPLASSSLPSIRDFLDVDKLTEAHEKRQARKKKKGENKVKGDEGKINRDYQQLNSYIKSKES